MIVGERLRELRKSKKLSQTEFEERTGLHRCYISRVENGHAVPTIETLEKLARALEVSLYQFFYRGEEPPRPPVVRMEKASNEISWGNDSEQALYMHKLRACLSKATNADRKLIMDLARKIAERSIRGKPPAERFVKNRS
jgi:transcriptional regulator with XRE-family HTH domain